MDNPIFPNIWNKFILNKKDSYFLSKIQVFWFFFTGRNEKAIQKLLEIIQDNRFSYRLLFVESEKLIDFQVYEETKYYLESVAENVKNKQEEEKLFFLLAKCCYGQGLVDDALKYIEKAIKLDSNKISYWNLKADCLLEFGDWEGAVMSLNKSLRASPGKAETVFRLGNIYLYHGEYSEALNCFSGCCKLKPSNPHYWEMKAEMHLKFNEIELACQSFQKAVRYGGNIELISRLAYCYAQQGKLKKAKKLFEKVLKYEPVNFDALCNLGGLYQNQGNNEQAYKYLKKAYLINSEDHILLNNLGYTSFSLGRTRKAIEYYKGALKIKPNDTIVLYNLGVCYAQKGKWEEGIRTIEKLLSLDPDNSEGWALLGNMYEKAAKYATAVDCYNKSLGLA